MMRQLFLDDEPVSHLPDEPLFFIVGLNGEKNPSHFYRNEALAAAQARCMTSKHHAEFIVAQIRSFHQKQLDVVSVPLFNNITWPRRFKPGAFGARRRFEAHVRRQVREGKMS